MNGYIVVCGNPVDGFEYVGPFEDAAQATEYASDEINIPSRQWWIAELDKPQTI